MSAVNTFLKVILPRRIVKKLKHDLMFLRLARRYVDDLLRFARCSGAIYKSYDQTQLDALITLDYHKLEKGLSLNNPRYGFGLKAVAQLQQNLLMYYNQYGHSDIWFEAYTTLREYYEFNEGKFSFGADLLSRFEDVEKISDVSQNDRKTVDGGTRLVLRTEIEKATAIDYESFFNCRHSIRDYADKEVDLELVLDAVSVAQKAPSVCNRQAGNLYVLTDKSLILRVLEKHGGARGFEQNINKLFVITSEVRTFHFLEERNQVWIDGGIYTMALLSALHSKGLGACCLNWSVARGVDLWLRDQLSIPDSKVVICLISIGHLPEQLRVAVSPRKSLDTIVKIL